MKQCSGYNMLLGPANRVVAKLVPSLDPVQHFH